MVEAVYKICRPLDWARLQSEGVFAGSDDDLRDGFIHFSTCEQVMETLRRHFAADRELVVLVVPLAHLGAELVFEPSRGGADFPHLYRPLRLGDVQTHFDLQVTPGAPDLAAMIGEVLGEC